MMSLTGAMKKIIVNETMHEISITLYVRKGVKLKSGEFGTINATVEPGQEKQVFYGDLQNGYLNAFCCTAIVDGKEVKYSERVKECGCHLDNLLNHKDILRFKEVEFEVLSAE